jgi:hypothetical protein
MKLPFELDPTVVSVVVVIVHLVVHLFLLVWWSSRLQSEINRSGFISNKVDVIGTPPLIHSFLLHLCHFDGKIYRTAESLDFLSDHDVLGRGIHYKYLSMVSSQLLGLGITGTFFALRDALLKLDDVATVGQLTGKALASSLAGLSASIVFSIVLSARSAGLRASLYRLAHTLDLKYPYFSMERIQMITLQRLSDFHAGFPVMLDKVLAARTETLKTDLKDGFADFEKAWSSSVSETTAKWTREFESGALRATKSYQEALDKQRTATFARLATDLESAGRRFSATLRGAVSDIREESTRAFSSGLNVAKSDLEMAVKSMVTGLNQASSSAVTDVGVAAKIASDAGNEVKNSFGEIRGLINESARDLELSAGRAVMAFEQAVKLMTEACSTGILETDDWHRQAVDAELKSLQDWTRQIRTQIDKMLADFSKALTDSVVQTLREVRSTMREAERGPESHLDGKKMDGRK